MSFLGVLFGSKSNDMAREWKLSLNFNRTRAKYIADGSLDQSCSIQEMELRAILDSPIAM